MNKFRGGDVINLFNLIWCLEACKGHCGKKHSPQYNRVFEAFKASWSPSSPPKRILDFIRSETKKEAACEHAQP